VHGVLECMLPFVPARVTVWNKARQGITDAFWKESRLRMACACGAVGPKVTFRVLAAKGHGRNNDSNTWVSGYRMQSAEFKK